MRSQIESLESALGADRNSIASRIRNEYKEAARREALLRQDYETEARIIGEQAERAIQYNILKREADSTREIYDAMLQRVATSASVARPAAQCGSGFALTIKQVGAHLARTSEKIGPQASDDVRPHDQIWSSRSSMKTIEDAQSG